MTFTIENDAPCLNSRFMDQLGRVFNEFAEFESMDDAIFNVKAFVAWVETCGGYDVAPRSTASTADELKDFESEANHAEQVAKDFFTK